MKIQLLSDLHLETEVFDPEPTPGADVLVLAGDIDSTWAAFERFAGWPVPVLVVAGNHEFDGRELDAAWPALHERCARFGLTLLNRSVQVLGGVRFVGTTRWSDFGLFGEARRPRAERAAGYFFRLMNATRRGQPFDVAAARAEGLLCRAWLESALCTGAEAGAGGATVVVTHFAPSLRSADPRYGAQPGTAAFCNADDDLLARADLWLHGHLHCRHDYAVARPGRAPMRVVSQARGHSAKGEAEGFVADRLIELLPGAGDAQPRAAR